MTAPYVGSDLLMWSSDYPHQNSTWPHSREVIARDLSDFSPEDRDKMLWKNVVELHKIKVPEPVTA